MEVGDRGFFYHSNTDPPAIVGTVEVVKGAYPDPYAFDPKSRYFDPKSTSDTPRWFLVDIKLIKTFSQPLSLEYLRTIKGIEPLSWQKQHRDSCKQKYDSCYVFDEKAEGSNRGMVVGKPGFVMMVFEVIGRKTDENGWNGDQRAHKGDDRERDQADPHFFGDP